jgi:hypothetical protein
MPAAAVESRRLVRVTTDLDEELFDDFRDFTHHNRVHQTKVLRALVRILTENEDVAEKALDLARSYAESERAAGRGAPGAPR